MSFCTRIALIVAPLVALAAVGAADPRQAFACDFEEPPPPEEALQEAVAVFAGQVVSIEPVDDDPTEQYNAVSFDVDRAWKGVDSSPITVETHQDEATCGFPFDEGERYLVYAHGGEGQLMTALFHRTTLWERADNDLNVLGEGTEVDQANAEGDAAADDGFSLGVFVLLIVLVSIAAATVILIRQSKPGFPKEEDLD